MMDDASLLVFWTSGLLAPWLDSIGFVGSLIKQSQRESQSEIDLV